MFISHIMVLIVFFLFNGDEHIVNMIKIVLVQILREKMGILGYISLPQNVIIPWNMELLFFFLDRYI